MPMLTDDQRAVLEVLQSGRWRCYWNNRLPIDELPKMCEDGLIERDGGHYRITPAASAKLEEDNG